MILVVGSHLPRMRHRANWTRTVVDAGFGFL